MAAINFKNLINTISVINAFAVNQVDISAKGLVRVVSDKNQLDAETIIHQLLPRDYDIPVTQIELDRIRGAL